MTLWLRATKWVSGRPVLLAKPAPGGSSELVAQSHKEWAT